MYVCIYIYIQYISLNVKIQVKLLQYCCLNVLYISLNVNILGYQNVHCTWCIYDMVQRITWWWLLRVETCRYMHNLTIINRCVWLKLYILISQRCSRPYWWFGKTQCRRLVVPSVSKGRCAFIFMGHERVNLFRYKMYFDVEGHPCRKLLHYHACKVVWLKALFCTWRNLRLNRMAALDFSTRK
jgi:hypothetical protein